MSDIEASVTKLLIATKQLLECLTQWSRLEASESDVSDIYVSLGNEFNRATISFQNAGIDMSDLEDTPVDLRNILERALGEEASVANLDKFLPRIREIIINLLQGLKRKQQIHRIQSGEAAAPIRMRRTESQGSQQTAASRSIDIDMSRQRSTSPSVRNFSSSTAMPNTASNGSLTIPAGYGANHRQLPVLSNHNTSPSQIQSPRKAPTPPMNARDIFTPAPAILTNSDPVTQLSQMTLERRSSKRFSENYLAQLTSSPSSDRSGKLSVDGVRKHLNKSVSIPETIEDESAEHTEYSASRAYGSPPPQAGVKRNHIGAPGPTLPSPTYKRIGSPRIKENETHGESSIEENNVPEGHLTSGDSTTKTPETLMIFIKVVKQVKKVTLVQPITFEKLRKSIFEIFGDQEPYKIYIEDGPSKVLYELDDIEDVRQRAMLIIRTERAEPEPTAQAADQPNLRLWLEDRLQKLSAEVADVKLAFAASPKEVIPTISEAVSAKLVTAEPVDITAHAGADIEAYQAEIQELKTTIAELKELPQRDQVDAPLIVVSASRDKVMSMSAKHEHRGTELTAKLEEAMNTMERIRKDVLQRKVTPRPQQLADLSREFEAIARESAALEGNLVLLDAASNKLWEEELTIITTEQDALEYQRAFVDDIKADLEQSLSSLSTIKQVEEQKRNAPITSVPTIIDTTIDPSRAIKFVQADIKSLQVNHERRTAAIADAEKRRVKDREYLLENEFKNELGSFVESNALKNTGGAAEIERLRQEKDSIHRKRLFSTDSNKATDSSQAELPQNVTDLSFEVKPRIDEKADMEAVAVKGPSPDEDTMANTALFKNAPLAISATDITPEMHPTGNEETVKVNGNRAVSSSASILARIDAAKTVDVIDRRRSSMIVKHSTHSDNLLGDQKDKPKHVNGHENGDVQRNSVPEVPIATNTI